MTRPTLHYIFDPLCGWCYGAAPLVAAARAVVTTLGHAGGMMAGDHRQPVSARLRNHVVPHDHRIARLTGQPFGAAYFDDLLRDESAVFDSEPPITAILAAQQLAGRGLDLLARAQVAHYQEGRRIAEPGVLGELAVQIGLVRADFERHYEDQRGAPTQAHIAQSRALLARAGGRGFPTFVLEDAGQMTVLDVGPYLGRPEAWAAHLSTAR